MNAKITTGQVGNVFYDGECPFCTSWARRFARTLAKRGFALATLQSRAGVAPVALNEMRLLLADGRELGGADAIVEIARRIWWAWPLFALAQIPGAMPLLRAGYRKFAANRYCLGDACDLHEQALPHHRHAAFLELP